MLFLSYPLREQLSSVCMELPTILFCFCANGENGGFTSAGVRAIRPRLSYYQSRASRQLVGIPLHLVTLSCIFRRKGPWVNRLNWRLLVHLQLQSCIYYPGTGSINKKKLQYARAHNHARAPLHVMRMRGHECSLVHYYSAMPQAA